MKKDPKLLMLLGGIGIVVIAGFIWMSNSSPNAKQDHQPNKQNPSYRMVSGDTNNVMLRQLIVGQQQLKKENDRLRQINQRLERQDSAANKQALENNRSALQSEIDHLKVSLSQKINQISKAAASKHMHQPSSDLEYAVGRDSETGKHPVKSAAHMITNAPDLSSGVDSDQNSPNIESAQADKSNGPSLPSDHALNFSSLKQKGLEPYYTIPDGSTLPNVALLSPLIGEVPVNGQLKSPAFPFKAIVSAKETEAMFSANGIPLPSGMSGTILQGYSVGSMSLGCARAYVMKILFVFNDGHFVVYPEDSKNTEATKVYPQNAIGYLSDPYNNSCINGQYITDAPKVIATLSAFGAASGVGGAIAQAQTQTLSNISQGTSGTIFTGNLGKYATGTALGEGSRMALEWYKSRVNDIFDAVFVTSTLHHQPRQFILNITKTIPIDLNTKGRTLSYEHEDQLSASDHALL